MAKARHSRVNGGLPRNPPPRGTMNEHNVRRDVTGETLPRVIAREGPKPNRGMENFSAIFTGRSGSSENGFASRFRLTRGGPSEQSASCGHGAFFPMPTWPEAGLPLPLGWPLPLPLARARAGLWACWCARARNPKVRREPRGAGAGREPPPGTGGPLGLPLPLPLG